LKPYFRRHHNIILKNVDIKVIIVVHCITLYYAHQEISWKPGKTSKFRPIYSTIQIWTDFNKNEAKKLIDAKPIDVAQPMWS
jgi:hypothetical protein